MVQCVSSLGYSRIPSSRCCGKAEPAVHIAFPLPSSYPFDPDFIIAYNMAKAGSPLPDVVLQEGAPDKDVKITDLFKGKKGILFGVPGAFTPGCSKTHLPGYVTDFDKLSKAGAEVIVCVSVNDAFVMGAWGEANGAKGKVHMLADTHGNLAKALGLELDMADKLGSKRCKRFSAVVDNNVIKTLNVEPDGAGLTCSLSNEIMGQLSQA